MVEKLLEDIRKRGNSQQEMEMVKIKKKRDWRLYVFRSTRNTTSAKRSRHL